MIYSAFHRGGGGTLPLVASPLSLGGGAYDRDVQHGDARHHRPGVSGRDYRRFCGGNGPQQRRWFRNAMAAYRGRADADSVGCKPSRGMGGRRGVAYADGSRNAYAQSHHRLFKGWESISGQWKRNLCTKHGAYHQTNHVSGRSGLLCNCDTDARYRTGPQQHAAVAGRGPLEARGIGYAVRKGAAV